MWPFEPKRTVLRIGRRSVELWRREPAGLARAHAIPLNGRDELGAALRDLFNAQPGDRARLDVVLESAWLPVVLLETGHEVWARDAVDGLLRHRLARVYDERDDAAADWELASDHRPGERFGVGYGLSPRVRSVVEEACTAAGWTMASLQPALQWARRRSPARSGWWVWLEQDRALVAFLERGRMTALQPAADVPHEPAHLVKTVQIEQRRAGIETAPEGIALAGWDAPFVVHASSGLTWQGVATHSTPPVHAVPAGSTA